MTQRRKSIMLIAAAVSSVGSTLAWGQVLFSNLNSTPTQNYFTFDGNDSSQTPIAQGGGDDYNTGYHAFTLTGLEFYGGETNPYSPEYAAQYSTGVPSQYGVAIAFYNPAGSRTAVAYVPTSDVYGVGYHSIPTADLEQNGVMQTITGAGYFAVEPFYYGLAKYNTTTGMFDYSPPPPGEPTFTLSYGGKPTTGANNPTLSAQIQPGGPGGNGAVLTGAYALGGDTTQQSAQFELDGTPVISSRLPSLNPVWLATGSGTWSTTANWTQTVPNGTTYSADLDEGITSNTTITLVSPETVYALDFDNPYFTYTIAGSSPLTIAASSGTAAINSWSGSHLITAPLVFPSDVNITTFADPSPASPSLILPLAVTASGTLYKLGTGTLLFSASASGISTLNLPGINISAGTLELASNSVPHNRTVLETSALSITGGLLDLGNNDLDLAGGGSAGLTLVNGYVAMAYNGGAWNGAAGVTSSVAAGNSSHLTTLGVILNSVDGTPNGAILYSTFDGNSASSTDVLVKYTYYGDADLNGIVDGSDYSRIDNGCLSGLTGWYNGDFNYDGAIDGSDYTLIDNAFNTQGATLASEVASPSVNIALQIAGDSSSAAVPEPSSIVLFGVGAAGLLRRRYRSQIN